MSQVHDIVFKTMRDLLENREKLQSSISDMQCKKQDIEHALLGELIQAKEFECFKIDYDKLKRLIYL